MPGVIQVVNGTTVIQAGENTVEAARQAAIATVQAERAEAAAVALLEWYQPDYTLNLDSGFYRANNGDFVDHAGYGNIVYPLTGNEIGLRVTVTLGGSAMAGATYFDAGGAFISAELAGDNQTYTNYVLSPPAGARTVKISGLDNPPNIKLEEQRILNGAEIATQSRAAYSASTRTALQAAGTIAADYGQTAEVYGHTAAGDSFARYVRGGKVYPTSNGWGLLASTASGAMAYGLAATFGETDRNFAVSAYDTLSRKDAEDFSEDYVELSGAGLYTLNSATGNQLIYADTAAGQTREIDAAHIALGRRYNILHRNEAHNGRLIIDAGFNQIWLAFGTRYLVVPTGVSIEIQRLSTSNFVVLSTASLGGNSLSGLAEGDYESVIRSTTYWYGGQSLKDQGFDRGGAHGAFAATLAARGGPVDPWGIDIASGGSGICERDVEAPDQNYWVDMTDPANPADGPLLIAAQIELAAKGGDARQPAIAFGLWDQGQQSSGYVDSPQAPNPNFTKAHYKTATAYAWSRLRTFSGNGSLKIGVQPLGRRSAVLSTNTGRMQVIREAQQELVAADANLFWLGETWDVSLRDSVHPDQYGYRISGERAADMVAKHVYGVTSGIYDHPTVTAASFNATRNSVDVTFTAGGAGTRFYKPVDPWGFRVVNSSGVEVPIAKAWWSSVSGNTATVRLFLDGSAAGGALYYVWDYGPGFDPTKAVRTRSSEGSKATRAAKVAL